METTASILVVDDEPGIRDLLAFELGQAGHAVTLAKDGNEAIECALAAEFDVVISDVSMPGKSGIEVLRAVKAASPDTEVVIMTAFGDFDSALDCLRAGAIDFIAKPFNIVDMLFAVERALERRELRGTADLYRAGQAVFATPQPQELPRVIVQIARAALEADQVSLMLPDENGGGLHVAEAHGLPAEALAERDSLSSIARRVAAARAPVLLPDDMGKDPRLAGLSLEGRAKSSIVFPLYAGDRLVGVLNFSRTANPRPFRRRDVERAGVLGSQVLLALENLRLVRQLVSTDRLATMGQLAASFAHQINNPVDCVISNQDILRDTLEDLAKGKGDKDQLLASCRQSLAGASEGAARIGEIVRDMGSLSRKDSGARDRVDLNQVIRSALRLFAVEVRRRAKVATQFGTDVEVMGSSGPLSQALMNLLVNAAQAMAGKQGVGQITLISLRRENEVVVEVADTGSGIAPEHLPRIFDAFFTTKGAGVGTGLGLSISRDIVRDHGGEISVESVPGAGATFRLVFPAAAPALKLAQRKLRLLFVDDEEAMLSAYQRAFDRQHEVVVATTGEEALELLGKGPGFDLIACDISLPGIDGLEVFRRAREANPRIESSFVFVSGSLGQDDVQAFLRTVKVRAIEKPFHLKPFQELVEREARA